MLLFRYQNIVHLHILRRETCSSICARHVLSTWRQLNARAPQFQQTVARKTKKETSKRRAKENGDRQSTDRKTTESRKIRPGS